MTMNSMKRRLLAAAAALCLTPVAAHAQSAFTGTVKDTSGAVLPGVTVEAASDALIEKTRSVVTDANGGYRLVDLRQPHALAEKNAAVHVHFGSHVGAPVKSGDRIETFVRRDTSRIAQPPSPDFPAGFSPRWTLVTAERPTRSRAVRKARTVRA